MAKRRTYAQIAHDNRAAHAVKIASPIAALRAARRAERDFDAGRSAQDVVRHLVLHAGCSFTEVARKLEHMGFRTPRGGLRWSATQAEREFRRRGASKVERGIPPRKVKRGVFHTRTPRFRAGESKATQGTDLTLITKVDRARAAWWELTTNLPPDAARPAEPLLDSRGRVLKGRRFSRIKKTS
jgi:hypothetical protein